MATVLDSLPQGARVAVLRLRSLGDCVLTTPALDLLKRARPDLRIAVAVEDRFRAVFEGNPDIELLTPPEIAAVRRWSPELCLNLHGGSTSARLTAASGARLRAGFQHYRFSFLYNVRIPRAQEILGTEGKVHTAEHLASALFFMGAPRIEIPRAKLFAEGVPKQRPYAVLHPFASHPSKTWPAERFLAIAERIHRAFDLEPVFIAGPGEDGSVFHPWRVVAGASLAEIKSLLKGASLFIGNDSGPAHMAAAFGLPVLVIFGSSDIPVWRPWRTQAEVLSHPDGIASVELRDALDALERLRVHA